MNRDRLKKKYLKRAHQLLHTKPGNSPPTWKLQASVEPFAHSHFPSRDHKHPPPFERSVSDPPKSSSHHHHPTPLPTDLNHHHIHHPEWAPDTDTCSESDTQSVSHTPLPNGTYNPPFTTGNQSQPHYYHDKYQPSSSSSRQPHPVRPSSSLSHTDGEPPTSASSSQRVLAAVSPSDRSYKHSTTIAEGGSSQLFDALLFHPHDGDVTSGVYPISSTPIVGTRFSRVNPQELESVMEERCSELDSKLKVQMNVNRELKRLLVASVGSDLQLRLDQIVQEKATLSHELETSLQQLTENSEDIDRISIECDIWRSKFLASRLMIDELASWKAELSLQFKESQRALQCLLKEHEDLKKMLAKCNGCLKEAVESLNYNAEGSGPSPEQHCLSPHSTVLDLAQVAMNYAKSLRQTSQQVGPIVPYMTTSTTTHGHNSGDSRLYQNTPMEPTVGEKLAKQVLKNRQQFLNSHSRTFPLPLQLDDNQLIHQRGLSSSHRSRLSPLSGHSSFLFSLSQQTANDELPLYCRCCKGKVMCL